MRITGTFDAEGALSVKGWLVVLSRMQTWRGRTNDPEIGPSFADAMLAFLANKLDVDLDGNGEVDACLHLFVFSVPAFVDRESECAE